MSYILIGAILMICSIIIAYDHHAAIWPEGQSILMLFANATVLIIGAVMILFELYKMVAP